jgi:ubiquinone/menaquinone biosynthesis C-methylase UbiE
MKKMVNKENLLNFYRKNKRYFETDERIDLTMFLEEFSIFLSYLNKDAVILEVGCGAGKLINKVGKLKTASHVLGLDISPIGVKTGKTNSKTSNCFTEFIIGDAETLPQKSESVDLVISNNVFEHLTDPQKCISEIARVLKSGGLFAMNCPNSRFSSGPIALSEIVRHPRKAFALRFYLSDYIRFVGGFSIPLRFLRPDLSFVGWSSDKDAVCAINIFKAIEMLKQCGFKAMRLDTWLLKSKILRRTPFFRFMGGQIIIVGVKL